MKTLAKFRDSFLANIAKGLLLEEGIESTVLGENLVWSIGVTDFGGLAVRLTVNDEDFDKAREILAASQLANDCEIQD